MTETLFTGTLNKNQNKNKNKTAGLEKRVGLRQNEEGWGWVNAKKKQKKKLSPYPKTNEQGFPLSAGQNCSSPTIIPQALKKVLGLYRMKKWAGACPTIKPQALKKVLGLYRMKKWAGACYSEMQKKKLSPNAKKN